MGTLHLTNPRDVRSRKGRLVATLVLAATAFCDIASLQAQEPRSLPTRPFPEEDPQFEASFAHGLRLHSTEDDWEIHLGGRWLGHERVVFDHPEDSGFRTREALVQLDAQAWKHFALRVAGDFTPVDEVPAARFHELYFRWTPEPDFALTAGLDKFMSLLYTEGVERPITATFQAPEEPGLLAAGALADGFLTYTAAISDGWHEIVHPSVVDDSQLGLDAETGHFALKYYLSAIVRPFAESPDEFLNGLRLGLFAAANFTSGVDPYDSFQIKSPDLGIRWLSPAAAEGDLFFQGRRLIVGADPSWTVGPFLLRGEFLFRRDHVARLSTAWRRPWTPSAGAP